MCQKNNPRVIDECLREDIKNLNEMGIVTLGSCCGHGRYQKTIVVTPKSDFFEGHHIAFEIFSGKYILRKSRFYVKDTEGYFFIPEVEGGSPSCDNCRCYMGKIICECGCGHSFCCVDCSKEWHENRGKNEHEMR